MKTATKKKTTAKNTVQGTPKDFAARWNVETVIASAFIKFLAARGHATKVGERKSESAGRPASVYEIPETVPLTI